MKSRWWNRLAALCAAGLLGTGIGGAALAAPAPSFDEADANRDGVVSQAEASKVEGLDFAKADRNRDGMLDRSEYEAAIG